MKTALLSALLLSACATITKPFEARCNENIHEILHTDGVWRARIDCRGELLTCYWSDQKEEYRPLRWASDACLTNHKSGDTK